jgi:hypothetical protein
VHFSVRRSRIEPRRCRRGPDLRRPALTEPAWSRERRPRGRERPPRIREEPPLTRGGAPADGGDTHRLSPGGSRC